MKQLYFVRHGLSVLNQSGLFSGRTDTPLNDEGREQAKKAGQVLRDKHIDCIISSPLSRTLETASIIAEQIGYPLTAIQTNDDLVERDFGPLELTTYQADLGDVEGVETIDDLIARVERSLTAIKALPCDTVLVVSHGAVGRAMRHILNPAIPFRPSEGLANGEVVEFL